VKVQCPGYRNPADLIFRDQNQLVAQKYHQRRIRGEIETRNIKDSRHDRRSLISETSTTLQLSNPRTSIPVISFPTEELIIPFFLDYFAAEYNEPTQSIMPWLNRSMGKAEDRILSAAVTSVGYAVFSNIQNCSSNRTLARQRYGMAIRLINLSLQGSIAYETNNLLTAIILLSLFEVSLPITRIQSPTITLSGDHML
jgi:hypothetical protein